MSVSTTGGTGNIDALLVMPEVATLATTGGGHSLVLLTSKSGTAESRTVSPPGSGPAYTASFDRNGRLLGANRSSANSFAVQVASGGFTITVR